MMQDIGKRQLLRKDEEDDHVRDGAATASFSFDGKWDLKPFSYEHLGKIVMGMNN